MPCAGVLNATGVLGDALGWYICTTGLLCNGDLRGELWCALMGPLVLGDGCSGLTAGPTEHPKAGGVAPGVPILQDAGSRLFKSELDALRGFSFLASCVLVFFGWYNSAASLDWREALRDVEGGLPWLLKLPFAFLIHSNRCLKCAKLSTEVAPRRGSPAQH